MKKNKTWEGEANLSQQLIDLAHWFRWQVVHFRPARTERGWRTPVQGDKGFPDLVLVKPPKVIFAELKSEIGEPTLPQREWLNALAGCPGVEVYLWRPSCWGEICQILSEGEIE